MEEPITSTSSGFVSSESNSLWNSGLSYSSLQPEKVGRSSGSELITMSLINIVVQGSLARRVIPHSVFASHVTHLKEPEAKAHPTLLFGPSCVMAYITDFK